MSLGPSPPVPFRSLGSRRLSFLLPAVPFGHVTNGTGVTWGWEREQAPEENGNGSDTPVPVPIPPPLLATFRLSLGSSLTSFVPFRDSTGGRGYGTGITRILYTCSPITLTTP